MKLSPASYQPREERIEQGERDRYFTRNLKRCRVGVFTGCGKECAMVLGRLTAIKPQIG
ncbi:hypothetical protein [Coleofasciculus sp. E1-EBD-02]|uniref:hypothetical protein n=1 Tax=Coleofasciculus sp. E1-EBD-02 TaxID=3068481 RepID=UPI0033014DAA